MKNRNGIALIAVIMIIMIASVAVFGITIAIANASRLTYVRIAQLKAYYAAQRGINDAINVYYQKGSGDPAQTGMDRTRNAPMTVTYQDGSQWPTPPDKYAGVRCSFLRDMDFLLINASNVKIDPTGLPPNSLGDIAITNLSQYDITVTGVKVEWYNITNTLKRIRWENVVQNIANGSSGATYVVIFPIARKVVGQPFISSQFSLTFDNAIPDSAIILVTFYDSADSNYSRKAVLLNNAYTGNNEFSISATGTADGRYRRTVEATLDVGTLKITSWQETDRHIM